MSPSDEWPSDDMQVAVMKIYKIDKRRCALLNSTRARKYDTIAASIGCAKSALGKVRAP
jgi:hypothetical protein